MMVSCIEKDEIRREAVKDVMSELAPILGMRFFLLDGKQMQIGFPDETYTVNNPAAYNPKTLGKAIADIMMYGKCDLKHTVRRKK